MKMYHVKQDIKFITDLLELHADYYESELNRHVAEKEDLQKEIFDLRAIKSDLECRNDNLITACGIFESIMHFSSKHKLDSVEAFLNIKYQLIENEQ